MSKKISKSIKKIRVLCILTIFAISLCNPEVYASKLKEKYRTENNNYFGDEQNAEKYYDFLKKYNNYSKDVDEINVSLQNSNLSKQQYQGRECILWDESEIREITFEFDNYSDGLYNLEIDYITVAGTLASPQRKIRIDGVYQYKELAEVTLTRLWRDDGKPIKNLLGDEVSPKQIEVFEWQTAVISDSTAQNIQPLMIYLSEGRHSVTFEYVSGEIALSGLRFTAPQKLKSYSEVLREYEKQGYKNGGSSIKIQAEDYYLKSDSAVKIEYSSDPMADPKSDMNRTYNVLGGSNWNRATQSVIWKFKVDQSGLYRIDLRTYEKYTDGLSVYRTIYIDDEIPYAEFVNYEFEYGDWQTAMIGDGEKPYLIYLSEGEHTLKLSVSNEPYRDILYNLTHALDLLSEKLQEIIMITSISPDSNFDYELDKKIPGLIEDKQSMKTLPLALQMLQGGAGQVARQGAFAAAALITTAPTILLFLIMQSKVVKTMAHTGIK